MGLRILEQALSIVDTCLSLLNSIRGCWPDSCMWQIHLTSVLVTGISTGLYLDYSHHSVLCCHVYGWYSQHGHLVLLVKGKKRPNSPTYLSGISSKSNKFMITIEIFFIFSCTKLDQRGLAHRLFFSSVWFFSWLSFIPAIWSIALPHNTSCMEARSILYRWGKRKYVSLNLSGEN